MMRFFRQLFGRCRREAEADEAMRKHRAEYDKELRDVRRRNLALKQLVSEIQRDVTAWH